MKENDSLDICFMKDELHYILYNSDDAYYHAKEMELANRGKFTRFFVIMFVDTILLISFAIEYKWWQDYPIITLILGLVYVIFILSGEGEGTIIDSYFRRFQQWKDYYESEEIWRIFDPIPISNGDYILLQNGKGDFGYLKLNIFNKRWDLTTPKYGTVVFSGENCATWYDVISDISLQIESQGYYVKQILNKFGDARWTKSDRSKGPYKRRLYIYKVFHWLRIIITIIVVFAPVAIAAPMVILLFFGGFGGNE